MENQPLSNAGEHPKEKPPDQTGPKTNETPKNQVSTGESNSAHPAVSESDYNMINVDDLNGGLQIAPSGTHAKGASATSEEEMSKRAKEKRATGSCPRFHTHHSINEKRQNVNSSILDFLDFKTQ